MDRERRYESLIFLFSLPLDRYNRLEINILEFLTLESVFSNLNALNLT